MTKRRGTKQAKGAQSAGARSGTETTRADPVAPVVSGGELASVDLLGLASTSMRLYGEWARVMVGASERELPAKDSRFADSAWREHPLYMRLAQAYLAFCEAADKVAEGRPHWRGRERARFLTSIITSPLAPTNTLVGNPAALRRVFETGGISLLEGSIVSCRSAALNGGSGAAVKGAVPPARPDRHRCSARRSPPRVPCIAANARSPARDSRRRRACAYAKSRALLGAKSVQRIP